MRGNEEDRVGSRGCSRLVALFSQRREEKCGQPEFRADWLSGLKQPTIPFLDPWIEDWPEPDHPFQGSHGQPPDFGEQLALPPPQPSPLPPPVPFPYPIPQPSPPPLFPPLPQDIPFFPGQPFPPHEFFNYNSTEDFSMSPHVGRCLRSLPSHLSQLPHAPFPA